MKVYEHRRDEKDTEIVVAEYQNVAEEFKRAVEALLIQNNIKSRTKIKRIKDGTRSPTLNGIMCPLARTLSRKFSHLPEKLKAKSSLPRFLVITAVRW